MLSAEDPTVNKDGSSSNIEEDGNDEIARLFDSQPGNNPTPAGKNFHPATVEDCPEEDGVATHPPKCQTPPEQAMPHHTPAASGDSSDASGYSTSASTATQNHSLPPFIQLNGQGQQHGSPSPDAMRYLDPESPLPNPESIQRSIYSGSSYHEGDTKSTSPSGQSHSSVPSSQNSEVFSQVERNASSYRSWSPGPVSPVQHQGMNFQNAHDQSPYPAFTQPTRNWKPPPQMTFADPRQTPFQSYAAPAMPSPYFTPGQPQHAPMPYPNPPITGYQHISQKLTGTLYGLQGIMPIYRRFETLNHRLLLQLQDELAVLEQELEAIDAADTNSRAGPMGILPASRRAEDMGQGELGRKKLDVLGHIGWRLGQYNRIISSFRETQYLSRPTHQEIEDYRGFLTHGRIIAEPETRFLNNPHDLVSLAVNDANESVEDDGDRNIDVEDVGVGGDSTPTPQSSAVMKSPDLHQTFFAKMETVRGPPAPIYFAYAVIFATIVPVVTFKVISGFAERMVIVALVFAGIAGVSAQSGLLAGLGEGRGIVDCVICVGLYGVLMAAMATALV